MQTPTPKQDAEALFNSMKGFRVKHSHVRKCAKIACDLLINRLPSINDTPPIHRKSQDAYSQHWQQVKIELDNCGKQNG